MEGDWSTTSSGATANGTATTTNVVANNADVDRPHGDYNVVGASSSPAAPASATSASSSFTFATATSNDDDAAAVAAAAEAMHAVSIDDAAASAVSAARHQQPLDQLTSKLIQELPAATDPTASDIRIAAVNPCVRETSDGSPPKTAAVAAVARSGKNR